MSRVDCERRRASSLRVRRAKGSRSESFEGHRVNEYETFGFEWYNKGGSPAGHYLLNITVTLAAHLPYLKAYIRTFLMGTHAGQVMRVPCAHAPARSVACRRFIISPGYIILRAFRAKIARRKPPLPRRACDILPPWSERDARPEGVEDRDYFGERRGVSCHIFLKYSLMMENVYSSTSSGKRKISILYELNR